MVNYLQPTTNNIDMGKTIVIIAPLLIGLLLYVTGHHVGYRQGLEDENAALRDLYCNLTYYDENGVRKQVLEKEKLPRWCW